MYTSHLLIDIKKYMYDFKVRLYNIVQAAVHEVDQWVERADAPPADMWLWRRSHVTWHETWHVTWHETEVPASTSTLPRRQQPRLSRYVASQLCGLLISPFAHSDPQTRGVPKLWEEVITDLSFPVPFSLLSLSKARLHILYRYPILSSLQARL